MILDRYLARQFLPIFLIAISMFVFLLTLIDLFANLVRYLNNEVPFLSIMKISLYFLPKCLSYAMPISLLFAAAYTLGDLYARNELTTVFSSGIPFWRFSVVLIAIGLSASVFMFFFEDIVVIPTHKIKTDLSKRALRQQVTETNSDIVIKARNGSLIYSVDYYDQKEQVLNGVSVIEMDDSGSLHSLIRAPSASWTGTEWAFKNAVIYQYEDGMLMISALPPDVSYNEHPDTFRRNSVNVEELPVRDAGMLVDDLRAAGLPFIKAQANYYHRFSFAVTSLIVMILSISMGGRFKKNILLMSLFASLSVAVVYYIMEMLSMTMAGLNYIPPFVGAWFPIFTFVIIGILLLLSTKT
ncbi:MAG: LptF/LptG family permease [Treponema sp.]|jgi:lipopolysaccharide export system permease protein|nr:LptF/LptG family permease [Treponema sp.]